jgi:uncharacterized lipoprotein YbaY
MKTPLRLLLAALAVAALGLAGCQHLDLAGDGDPQRVLTGTVNLRPDIIFPADTEVVVRVVDLTPADRTGRDAAADLALAGSAAPGQALEREFGRQTIQAPAGKPVPFRIEFQADDERLRHGLNVEARISYGGRVHFRTLEGHVVTLASIGFPHEVWVEAVN